MGLLFKLLTGWDPMARKTNYGFDRRERAKIRATKRAERQRAKKDRSDQRKDKPDQDQPTEHEDEQNNS